MLKSYVSCCLPHNTSNTMKFKFLKRTLCLMFCVILSFSCEKNVEEDIQEVISENEEDPSTPIIISFVNDVKPIIDSRCVQCHGGQRFPDLRTYQGIVNNASIIQSQVVSRQMPQGSTLTNEQIALINDWINNGAPNN